MVLALLGNRCGVFNEGFGEENGCTWLYLVGFWNREERERKDRDVKEPGKERETVKG